MTKTQSLTKAPLKRRLLFLGVSVTGVLTLVMLAWIYMVPFDLGLLERENLSSVKVVDRHGHDLREVLGPTKERQRWADLKQISQPLQLATIHAEDQRFRQHTGVDPIAIARATINNIRQAKIGSGASTITQQTVKMVMTRFGQRRGLKVKLNEALWALRLEHAVSKDRILEQYLNRAPYGNQLRGVDAASWMYFNKPAAHITLAEAALLAPITRAPSVLNPYTKLGQLKQLQRRLLKAMLERGAIDKDAYLRAIEQEILIHPRRGRVLAPHFTDYVLKKVGKDQPKRIQTTLDLPLQKDIQAIVKNALKRIAHKNVTQAAVVVLDTQTADVLAWVGSSDYWSSKHLGANDGVLASRQPGSALKPFVYARLLDDGKPSSTVFLDWQVQFQTDKGAYIPENYDRKFYGPVFMREALASSLNIPAVLAAERVGVDRLLETFKRLGFDTMTKPAAYYGLGLSLGNAEVRLIDLATAYTALGRGGQWMPYRVVEDATVAPTRDVFTPESSAIILDMLADDQARAIGFGTYNVLYFPFKVAAKTGTSVAYRDNWAVAMTPQHTVAVWVGNFDGKPMNDSSGITGAAPIARQVIQTLYPKAAQPKDVPWFEMPETLRWVNVCQYSGQRPTDGCSKVVKRLMRATQFEALPEDVMHRMVWIDPDNGLLAHEGCPGAVRQLRFTFPGHWLVWAAQSKRELMPTSHSPRCGGDGDPSSAGEETSLRILHPLQGDTFFVDHDVSAKSQQMELRVSVPSARVNEQLTWFVDGRPLKRVKAPFRAFWQLKPGEHRIGVGRGRVEHAVKVTVH